jgi:hypothetical protein
MKKFILGILTLAIPVCLIFIFPDMVTDKGTDEEILIVCTMSDDSTDKRYFLINKSRSIAKFMNADDVHYGKLTTTENAYILHFPKTKKRWEALHTINRYSGKLEWEHGDPPFGRLLSDNVFRLGVCSEGKDVKRF